MSNGPNLADVIVDIPSKAVDRAFLYLVPSRCQEKIRIGSTVVVPFGRRHLIGYVINLPVIQRRDDLNEIIDLLDEPPLFSPLVLELCHWMSEYYLCPLADCLKLFIPPGRIRRLQEEYVLTSADGNHQEQKIGQKYIDLIGRLKNLSEPLEKKDILKVMDIKALNKLLAFHLLSKQYTLTRPQVTEKKRAIISLAVDKNSQLESAVKGTKQRAMLAQLAKRGEMSSTELLKICRASNATLKTLVAKKLINLTWQTKKREPQWEYLNTDTPIEKLTADQERAVNKINKAIDYLEKSVFLLEGVTGSGKTEVYLQVISHSLRSNRSAIVMVPEISLTPQLTERFRHRFGDLVAVLHSGMGRGERYDQWCRINQGEGRIVIGARSALFAPLSDLGLIIIDEEHEVSYKQNRSPRYNARDVAEKLAELNRAVLILGSATPSLETRYRADSGLIDSAKLPERVSGWALPEITIVDMRQEFKKQNYSIISSKLKEEMRKRLARGEKVILFLNRRGYSAFLLCHDCGYVPKCLNCAVSLTYHQQGHRLICHHCRFSQPAPNLCPQCAGHHIRYPGAGTQMVEEEMARLFPDIPLIRMDADTTAGKDSHRRHLLAFARHKAAVLLGTQMVAKGLDFPDVSLIGIINADVALNLPDFRAAERTFQLLMQAAGRSGRGKIPGFVVIQTYVPQNYAIRAVKTGTFQSFYEEELRYRQELGYPPFKRMINLVVSGAQEERVRSRAEDVAKFLRGNLPVKDACVLGPGAAPIPKIKNRWRWHVLLTTTNADGVRSLIVENWQKIFANKKDTSVIIDIDPVWLL